MSKVCWLLAPLCLLACASGGESPSPPTPTGETTSAATPAPTPTPPPRPTAKADDALIPRAVFSGNPDFTNVQISPDGSQVAYLAPFEGVMNLWIAPIDKPTEARPLTKAKDRPIRIYGFAHNKTHAYYLQDKAGDENFHLYSIELASGASKDLTDLPKVRVMIVADDTKKPGELVIGLNDRDERFHDLYKLALKSGARTLLLKNEEGYAGFEVDFDHKVRLATKQTPEGGAEVFELKAGKATSFMKIPKEDALTTEVVGFDQDGKTVYLRDSRGRDTAALFAHDLAKGKATMLHDDARADVTDTLTHRKTGKVQAVAVEYERMEWKVLDPAIEPLLSFLKKELKGDVQVMSRSDDDRHWIVADLLDDGPASFHHFDTKQKKLTFLFLNRKSLSGLALAKMRPVVLKARDGLSLVSYLSLPPSTDPDGDGRPAQPMPLVLDVHGGPWARDSWGFRRDHQWLASRGYAVLSVNYRGSTGFGKSFTNAANGEWAGKMHDDLIDAVKWAVDQKVADPAKVAIYGGSYGGYSTLVGLTFTPTTFACGVDIVGPSNLATLLASIPAYWAPIFEMFVQRIGGDPRTDDGKRYLASRSPLSFVDKIQRPLLIGQGANDPRVKQAESDQIVKALEAKGIPVSYVLFPDEGHGFARPENRLAFDAVAEAFLAQCLGGAYKPIGDDFKGSTITAPAGAAGVVGLSEALAAPK